MYKEQNQIYQSLAQSQENNKLKQDKSRNTRFNTAYLTTCTPSQRRILFFLLKFKNNEWIRLKRATIAAACGCSIRTVSTAINKFWADLIFMKEQENRYAPNDFHVGERAFLPVLDMTEEDKKQFCLCYCTHINSYSSLSISNLSSSSSLGGLPRGRRPADCREPYKQKTFNPELKEKITLSAEVYREQRIRHCKSIGRKINISEQDSLKLLAYTTEVLDWAYKEITKIYTRKGKVGNRIYNELALFISLCQDRSKRYGYPIDWSEYFRACDNPVFYDKRTYPKFTRATVTQTRDQGETLVSGSVDTKLYKPFIPQITTESEKIARLRKDVLGYEKILSEGKFNMFCTKENVEEMLAGTKDQLAALDGGGNLALS